jgi:Flp pilus assembly pilin Flp
MSNTHSNLQHSVHTPVEAAQPSGFLHRFVGNGASLRRFLRDDRGMTTIEYAVLLAVIVVGSITLWTNFSQAVINQLKEATTAVETAGDGLDK